MTSETLAQPPARDKLDGLAFQFCKIATVALIAGKYTLLIAAALSSALFVWSFAKGARRSRCFVRYPLLLACIWALVAAGAGLKLFAPDFVESAVSRVIGPSS